MPLIFQNNNIWIAPNEIFYMAANLAQMRGRTFLSQNGIKYMGTYKLKDDDLKEFCSMFPNFRLNVFQGCMKVKTSSQQYQNEIIFYPYSYYGSLGHVGYPVVSFQAISPKIKKYKEWLGTDNRIFMKPYIKKYQSHLSFVKNCLMEMF